jgi:large subunit ribosomal protein L17
MAVIELVTEEYSAKQSVVKEAEGAAKNASKADDAPVAEETPAVEAEAAEESKES